MRVCRPLIVLASGKLHQRLHTHPHPLALSCVFAKPSDGLEPSTPSLPSSDDAGTAGTAGKPRARKPRKKKESAEDE
jgi:hypothetical protein